MSDWAIGTKLLDTYEVTAGPWQGGMGRVHKVHHHAWGRDLAVKSPLLALLEQVGGRDSFVREAETWVNLPLHPHVVPCFYVRTIDEMPRLFAEFVDGGSLASWIASRKLYEGGPARALERILDISIQFAWGLHHAHEAGLIHQDVKPANVMMTSGGVAKVTDFGLAYARTVVVSTATPLGSATLEGRETLLATGFSMTPAYCSPEQAKGSKLTRRTDIWSWAASVLEAFTGELTWAAGQGAGAALETYLEEGSHVEIERPGWVTAIPTSEIIKNPPLLKDPAKTAERQRMIDALFTCNGNQTRAALHLGMSRRTFVSKLGYYGIRWPQKVAEGIPRMPEGLVRLLERCFRPDEQQRPRDIPEVAEAVKEVYREVTGNDYRRPAPQAIDWLASGLNNRAVSMIDLGRTGEAAQLLEDALNADVQHLHAAYNSALLQWRTARIADDIAVSLLESVRATSEHNWEFHYLLGWLHIERGNETAARKSLLRARESTRTPEHTRSIAVALGVVQPGMRQATTKAPWAMSDPEEAVWLDSLRSNLLVGFDEKSWSFDEKSWKDKGVALNQARATPFRERSSFLLDLVGEVLLHSGRGHLRPGHRDTLGAWEERGLLGHADSVTHIALTRDGRRAISASKDTTLRVWELATGNCLHILRGHTDVVWHVTLTPDGQHAVSASADNTLRVWELSNGECKRILMAKPLVEQQPVGGIKSVTLTPNGRQAVCVCGDNLLRVLDLATGQCLRALDGGRDMDFVGLTSNGRHVIANCSLEQTLRIWDLATGQCRQILDGHADQVLHMALTPDGRNALSASADHTLRVWQLATGKCLHTLRGHEASVCHVAVTPDGRHAVSASDDRTLRVWDLATGQCRHLLQGHTGSVHCVGLTPDGHAISASDDRTLRVWHLPEGHCVQTISAVAGNCVAFTRDGRRAVWVCPSSPSWNVCVWFFDWELIPKDPADWDDGALAFLELFLSCHTPYLGNGVTRVGRPNWTEADFEHLIRDLQDAGYGWLRPEGVRRQLEHMAQHVEPAVPAPTADTISSSLAPPGSGDQHIGSARRGRGLLAAVALAPLAVAAGVVMAVPSFSGKRLGPPLPEYEITASGGMELRGADMASSQAAGVVAAQQRLRPKSRLVAIGRPTVAVEGLVATRVFVVQGSKVEEVWPQVQIAASGAVEVRAAVAEVFGGRRGHWDLVVLVGRSEALRKTEPAAALAKPSDPTWRRLIVPLDFEPE